MSYFNGDGIALAQSGASSDTIAASAAGQVVTGTGANDLLVDVAGGDTLIGGSGDDTYQVSDPNTQIIEAPGGGIDTVDTHVSFSLPANVENLTADQWGHTLQGNDGDNLITIFGGGDQIWGEGGNDVIVLSNSVEGNVLHYSPGSGNDAIYGFHTSTETSSHDEIDIQGYGIDNFSQLIANAHQEGSDAIIQLSATDSITLRDTQLSDLSATDFLFSIDTTKFQAPSFAEDFNSLTLYDPAVGGSTGWKTNYGFGAQYGPYDWTSRTEGSELEVYTDPKFSGTGSTSLGLNPFSVNNGILTITATDVGASLANVAGGHDWSSGLITSEKSYAQLYGYFEISAKLPSGAGMWPAFWLLPEQGDGHTELDAFEQTGGSTILQTVHDGLGGQTQFSTTVSTDTSEFHTYGVLWTPSTITFYIDGQATGETATPASMDEPMYLLANLAVSGGGWAGTPTANETSGQYEIDYIHAYTLAEIGQPVAAHTITGTPGADTLTAGAGADTLIGGAGNDTYIINNADQTVVEQPGGGTDTVESYVSYTAPANVENVTLLGMQNLDATGNSLNNVLIGNQGDNVLSGGAGNDTLIGGAGTDTLIGGPGNDTYVIDGYYDDGSDKIIEQPNGGIDTVLSAITFELPANVENLTLTGSDPTDGYGNALNNVIIGNAAANTLDGGAGNDTLTGGGGGDTFVFDRGSGVDIITDWQVGDTIDLTAYLQAGDHPTVKTTATEAVIYLDGSDHIELRGVTAAELEETPTGYVFHQPGPWSATTTIVGKPYTQETTYYSASGNVTGETLSGYTSGSYSSLSYAFDENHRITSETKYSAGGNVLQTETFSYNTDGSYVETLEAAPGASVGTQTISYNASGVALTEVESNFLGESYTSLTKTYSADGHLSEVQYSGFSGKAYTGYLEYFSDGGAALTRSYANNSGIPSEYVYQSGQTIEAPSGGSIIRLIGQNETINLSDISGNVKLVGYVAGSDSIGIASDLIPNFSALLAHAHDTSSGDVVITEDAHDSLILYNTTLTALAQHGGDFHFF